MMLATALTALTASLTFAAPAAIIYVPSPIFMDHMVLQREKAVPIWGVGSPVGSQVTVGFAGQTKTVNINPDGRWRVYLDPMPAGGPYRLEVRGAKTIAFNDVLVGEVWICSGQSNMARGGAPLRARGVNPYIRTYRHNDWQDEPSEMAYYLGLYLYDALGVPIGLINRAVSGSNIRTWLPQDASLELPPGMIEPTVFVHELEAVVFGDEPEIENTPLLCPPWLNARMLSQALLENVNWYIVPDISHEPRYPVQIPCE